MFLSEWREFPSAPRLAGKRNLMMASVWMLLKSRAYLTCFRACFLPGRAKDFSAPRVLVARYQASRVVGASVLGGTFVLLCQTTRRHVNDDRNIDCDRNENIRSPVV